MPGAESQPFVNFHDILANLSDSQKTAAVGAANWRLIDSGLATFGDVVTATRVRPFREVLARGQFSLKQLTDAGVSKHTATKAYATVHTPAVEIAKQHAAELIAKITRTGISREQVNRIVGEHFGAKVGIKAGPSGPSPSTITPTDIRQFIAGLKEVQKVVITRAAMRAKPRPAEVKPIRPVVQVIEEETEE